MPLLILLRQYSIREYAVTVMVAAVAGLGIVTLLNAAAGDGGASAELKTKPTVPAISSARSVTAYKPAAKTRPAARAHAGRAHVARKQRHRHHRRPAHVSRPALTPAPAPRARAPRVVAVQPPSPRPIPKPTYTPAPAPKPAPVVHKPAPKPKSNGVPGGGSGNFSDSG